LNAIDEKVLKFVLQKHKNGFPHYQKDDTDEGIQSSNPSEGTVAVFQIQYQVGSKICQKATLGTKLSTGHI